jgi:hypothetical protein
MIELHSTPSSRDIRLVMTLPFALGSFRNDVEQQALNIIWEAIFYFLIFFFIIIFLSLFFYHYFSIIIFLSLFFYHYFFIIIFLSLFFYFFLAEKPNYASVLDFGSKFSSILQHCLLTSLQGDPVVQAIYAVARLACEVVRTKQRVQTNGYIQI